MSLAQIAARNNRPRIRIKTNTQIVEQIGRSVLFSRLQAAFYGELIVCCVPV